MKNPQRIGNRKKAGERQAEYLEETTMPDGQRDQHRPKFIKWLRNKFGNTTFERMGGKLDLRDVKVGAPYTRVQHRPPARNR